MYFVKFLPLFKLSIKLFLVPHRMVQEHLAVVWPIIDLICQLVLLMLLEDARIVYEQSFVPDRPQAELGYACSCLVRLCLGALALCDNQIEHCGCGHD